MIDDPLSLLSLGVWLMAAGMWPVGFLFGACSACCDECGECDSCPHQCNFTCSSGGRLQGMSFSGSVGNLSFDETDFRGGPNILGQFALSDGGPVNDELGLWLFPVVDALGLPSLECLDESDGPWFAMRITSETFTDECGCPACRVIFLAELYYDTGDVPRKSAEAVASAVIKSCGSTSFSPAAITISDWDPLGGPLGFEAWARGTCEILNDEDAINLVKPYLDANFTVQIEDLSAPNSCCNKCTHSANGCNPNATLLSYEVEDYGSNQIENPGPEPAGSCFDNSVSFEIEQLPETSLAYFGEQCITPISLSPFLSEPDGCGCSACCFEVVFQAQFNFENDGFARFEAVAVLCFDGCDQTEATTAQLTEWSVVDEQGPTAELLEFLSSLALSTALTVQPCDCGACCDEGCEDNVAEGGCENWAGVGTSCCDDPDPCAEE